jgi:hypothetical protein
MEERHLSKVEAPVRLPQSAPSPLHSFEAAPEFIAELCKAQRAGHGADAIRRSSGSLEAIAKAKSKQPP